MLFFFFFIFERESMSRGGAERERERETDRIGSRLQALSGQHRALHGAQTHKL